MKNVLVSACLVFFAFFFLLPNSVLAQGTCQAERNPPITGSCTVSVNNCENYHIPVAFERGAHDSCACRCDPDPNNPPPAPPQQQCATCPGGGCDVLPCCSPCIEDINNITGICHCAYSPSTPDQDETTPSTPDEGDKTIETAIGPINVTSPEGFVGSILTLAIGIGGGIAMLLIIFGGFQVLTSGGDPEKVKAGKEMITSAITGLLLIIFAVFILQIIGVEILKLPDWG